MTRRSPPTMRKAMIKISARKSTRNAWPCVSSAG